MGEFIDIVIDSIRNHEQAFASRHAGGGRCRICRHGMRQAIPRSASGPAARVDRRRCHRAQRRISLPGQLRVSRLDFGQTQHICGATVVSNKWIITAAHCIIAGPKPGNYKVVVGRHSLRKFDKKTRRHNVRRVIVHPKWAGDYTEEMSNDIALIELKTPMSFNEFVQPACLPDNVSSNTTDLYQPGTPALISGWGEMDPKGVEQEEPGRSPSILRAASIPLIEWDACKNANFLYQEMVTETMTCAGFMDGGVDGCQGDSGGPLVKIVDGKATLLGVVSWGIGCAQPNNPGIYTNVAYELDWIREHIKN